MRVQLDFTNYLSLAQVEVYDNSNTNRAQNGGTATQSSTSSEETSADNAIDGEPNTHTHTNSEPGENQTDDLQLITRNTIVPHRIPIIFLFASNPLI